MSVSESSAHKAQKYELIDPDVRLMLRVQQGDARAFEKLVERYQARVVSLLEHLVSGRDQAEDLAQEVFLRVFRARESYIPTAKFSTWLFTITNNVASNAMRKMSRRREVNVSEPASANSLDSMAQEASGLMPTRLLDKMEMAEIVRLAMQSLNERQRLALLLSKFEGMSYLDIAETMNLSTQAVKSLLSRARHNLRQILEPYMESGQMPTSLPETETEEEIGD